MQNVRIITNKDIQEGNTEGIVYIHTNISVDFKGRKVKIWNGAYWKEIDFEEMCVLATWDE